jgi:hypothetical protein
VVMAIRKPVQRLGASREEECMDSPTFDLEVEILRGRAGDCRASRVVLLAGAGGRPGPRPRPGPD